LLAGLVAAGTAGTFGLPTMLRAAGAPLRLPAGPMRLERELVRELGGGAAITVRRSWELRFSRQARGIIISGTQVSVSVDAPPSLADLARIEEQRGTQAMFPIMLSEAGLVLVAGGSAAASGDMAPALRAAEQMIAKRPQSEERRENLLRYLAEIHRAGSGQFDTLPADLFYPAGTPLRRIEAVALPGGLAGEFELVWDARPVPGEGWLASGERLVITRIEGLERRSREGWSGARARAGRSPRSDRRLPCGIILPHRETALLLDFRPPERHLRATSPTGQQRGG
jgi:hypothetical protein